MDKPRIGLIGVGRMGSGMASNWLAKEFPLLLWDTNADGLPALAARGASVAGSPEELVRQADVVVTSLPSEAALIEIARRLADGGTSHDRANVLIDTSTVSPACKKSAFELLGEVGIDMLDAPLIGGAMQARAAQLTVLASGGEALYQWCLPTLRAISAQQHYVGAFGESTKLKLIVNHLVGISNVAVAETLALARHTGVDLATVHKVIASSPMGSGLWSARAALVLDEAWDVPARQSAQLLIPLKDNALIRDFAAPLHVALPLFEAAKEVYDRACGEGREHQDPAALYATLIAMSDEAAHGGAQ